MSGPLARRKTFGVIGLAAAVVGIVLGGIRSEAQPVTTGGLLTTVTPTRILDTRGGGKLTTGSVRRLLVSGRAGVPTGARAVALNVTAVSPTASTYLTVWPAGGTPPDTSSLNVNQGQTRPNAVIVGLGENGAIDIFNAFGDVDVLVDLTGWFSAGPLAAGGLEPIAPFRVTDTRRPGGGGPIGATGTASTVTAKVTGVGGVPETGVAAVVLNVTATGPTSPTFFTVWPNGVGRPDVSSLNVSAGETAANLVIVPVGTNGSIVVSNEFGRSHAIVDIMGWISSGTPGVGGFVPVAPTRMYDSRGGTGIRPRGWLPVKVGGSVIPTSGVSAVAANVTVVNPNAGSFVSTFPTGAGFSTRTNIPVVPLANVSTLNVASGSTVPNATIAAVGPEASFWVFNYEGVADLLVDVSGYWIGTTPFGNAPLRAPSQAGPGGFTPNVFGNGARNFWDTCGPITIKVDPTDGQLFGLDDVIPAIDRLRAATGLPLVYGGTTFGVNSLNSIPDRDVVIRWRTSAQDTALGGSTLAVARWDGYFDGEVAAGLVTMRTDGAQLRNGFGPGGTWGMVLLHELAHIFGLAHTLTDQEQLMFPSIQRGLGEFGAGDLTGLSQVRRDGCFLKAESTRVEMMVVD
jgi:hypothetical protein